MTRTKHFVLAAALAAGLALSAQAAGAVSIVNGSFEVGPAPGSFTTLMNGSTAITGWEVTGDSIDYIGSYWQPHDGERSIDLSGNSKGGIFQTLSGLTIGHDYLVKFWLAGNPDGGGSIKTAVVSDGGSQASVYNFLQPGNTKANMGWEEQSFRFTAYDTTADLHFSSTQFNPYGPALDGVSIMAVPEPATWAFLIMGFGGIGAALRSKRRPAFA
jgi:choice-of-anchor C domain-containing protein